LTTNILNTLALTVTIAACAGQKKQLVLVSDAAAAARDGPIIVSRLAAIGVDAEVVRADGNEIELAVSSPERVASMKNALFRVHRLRVAPFAAEQGPLTAVPDESAHFVVRRCECLGPEGPRLPVWDNEPVMRGHLDGLPRELGDRVAVERYFEPGGNATPIGWVPYLLAAEGGLSNAHVAAARVAHAENTGAAFVAVELTEEGKARFAELTERTVGRHLAIVIDGELQSAPLVMEPIRGGRIQITLGGQLGLAQQEIEAAALAAALGGDALTARRHVAVITF
jgi:hypothetical protein